MAQHRHAPSAGDRTRADADPAAGPGKARPGQTLRLFLFRGPGTDFSETDRALLTLLRPHLHHAYLDAERRRHPSPSSPRHWQLLDPLVAGHTNAQIARRWRGILASMT